LFVLCVWDHSTLGLCGVIGYSLEKDEEEETEKEKKREGGWRRKEGRQGNGYGESFLFPFSTVGKDSIFEVLTGVKKPRARSQGASNKKSSDYALPDCPSENMGSSNVT
jgi:hypothetical protein